MKNMLALAAVALGAWWLAPAAQASEWNQLTKVTFSAPVEIPGQVLPAGTYWFKLLNSESDRNIVQIYNAKQTKQVALLLAIPDYRLKPTGKTVLTFKERAGGSPEALKAWFYPGDNYGQEFVYPKSRATVLAKNENQPVLSMPQNLESNTKQEAESSSSQSAVTLRAAPVKAQQPSGSEAEINQAVTVPPQLLAQNNPPPARNAAPAPSNPKPATLPQTASDLPVAGFLGLALTGLGLLAARLARASS